MGTLSNTKSHLRTKIEILIKEQLRQTKQSMLSFLKDTLIAENGTIRTDKFCPPLLLTARFRCGISVSMMQRLFISVRLLQFTIIVC